MKHTRKLMSLLLSFVMIMSIFTNHELFVKADTSTKTIYFDNSKTKWSSVYAYVWGSGLAKVTVKSTNVKGSIYKAEISSEYSKLIFKNTKSTWDKQTADLAIPSDAKNCFVPSSSANRCSGTWIAYSEAGTTSTPKVTATAKVTTPPTKTPKATATAKPTKTPKVTTKPSSTPKVTTAPTAGVTATPNTNQTLTIYYKRAENTSWSNAYIHFKLDGVWTKSPGCPMSKEANGLWLYTVDLKAATQITACFTNGTGAWDSKSGKNYLLELANGSCQLVDQTNSGKISTTTAPATKAPTKLPTLAPTTAPSEAPTQAPTVVPTEVPATTMYSSGKEFNAAIKSLMADTNETYKAYDLTTQKIGFTTNIPTSYLSKIDLASDQQLTIYKLSASEAVVYSPLVSDSKQGV